MVQFSDTQVNCIEGLAKHSQTCTPHHKDGSLLPWETSGAQSLCYPVEPCDSISLAVFAGQVSLNFFFFFFTHMKVDPLPYACRSVWLG